MNDPDEQGLDAWHDEHERRAELQARIEAATLHLVGQPYDFLTYARMLDVSRHTVAEWCAFHGIDTTEYEA